MVNLLHLGADVIGILVSLALAFYCLMLIKNFFKGGIFEEPFKAFMVSGFFVAVTLLFNILAETVELKIFDLHIFHIILEISSGLIILYGLRRLYLAWKKLISQ